MAAFGGSGSRPSDHSHSVALVGRTVLSDPPDFEDLGLYTAESSLAKQRAPFLGTAQMEAKLGTDPAL